MKRVICSFTILLLTSCLLFGCSGIHGYSYDAHLGIGIDADARIPGEADRDVGLSLTEADVDGKKCTGPLYKWYGRGWEDTGINGGVNFIGDNRVFFFGDAYIKNGTRHNRPFYYMKKYKISKGDVVFDSHNYDHMIFWSSKSIKDGLNGRLDTSSYYMWKLTCD
jgi:hypothetical protein